MNKFARQTAAADASCAASDSQQLFYSSWFAGNEVPPPCQYSRMATPSDRTRSPPGYSSCKTLHMHVFMYAPYVQQCRSITTTCIVYAAIQRVVA